MATKRTYRVHGDLQPRLVKAGSQAQAVNHCVKGKYSATVATHADYEELWGNVKIEEATDEEAT